MGRKIVHSIAICVSRIESAFAGFVGFATLALLARQMSNSTGKMTLSILDTQIAISARAFLK